MTTGAALDSLGADSAALSAAAAAAEDALCLQREALAVLAEGWGGESGSSAVDLLQQQCAEGLGVMTELQRVAGQMSAGTSAGTSALWGRLADGSGPGAFQAPVPAAPPHQPQVAPPFQTAPLPAPALPAWTPSGMALPDIGGALMGLVAQIADSLGSGLSSGTPVDAALGVPPEDDPAGPAAAPQHDSPVAATPVAAPPPAEPLTAQPAAPPVAQPVAQPVEPPAAPVETAVTPDPVPLLSAELPPPVGTPPLTVNTESVPEPATPCEIAADELPQVGR